MTLLSIYARSGPSFAEAIEDGLEQAKFGNGRQGEAYGQARSMQLVADRLPLAERIKNTTSEIMKEGFSFTKDHGISINTKRPRTQRDCPIRGNSLWFNQNRLENQRHIPERIPHVLRPTLACHGGQMELKTKAARPTRDFWKVSGKEKFVSKPLRRHLPKNGDRTNPRPART
jgi:hypothetical protein